MRTVEVSFPGQGPPKVDPNTEAMLAGETVVWEIESVNPGISFFVIRFDAKDATFFNGTNSLTKPKSPSAKTIISGTAPEKGPRRDDKYTVAGLDAQGNPIPDAELDPMIITVQ